MKQWLSSKQKDVHVLGPLLPAGFGIETQNSEEGTRVDIETFLEEMLTQYGNRSTMEYRSQEIQFTIKASMCNKPSSCLRKNGIYRARAIEIGIHNTD
jgi:hypothetical protein